MQTVLRFLAALLVLSGGVSGLRAASLVIDAESGQVLHQDEASRPWYPASLTKIMTAYLVFEALESGALTLSTEIPVSKAAASQPPTKIGVRADTNMTVEQALGALVVPSANDAAVVLAEALAQSEQGFAVMMTAKARALGMRGTVFRNASGLPHPGQRTTARDMAILARALIRTFPEHYGFFSRRSIKYRGRGHGSTNRWVAGFPGADGIKTGFTCWSGYNLVGSAKRDGRRLISVVLGAKNSGARNAATTKLMTRGFEALAGPARNGVTVTDLDPGTSSGERPPEVLSAGQCAARSTKVANAPLSGWGIIFGAFRNKAAARKIASANKQNLKRVLDKGRIAVVSRQREGFLGYSALIVGLSGEEAGRACKHLWSLDKYCLSLAPKVLQNPDAIWR